MIIKLFVIATSVFVLVAMGGAAYAGPATSSAGQGANYYATIQQGAQSDRCRSYRINGAVTFGPLAQLAAAEDRCAASQEVTTGQHPQADTGQHLPTVFRVQPTIESVREGLELTGPPCPAQTELKNAIERSASELRDKLTICRGC
jgi:type IV secretory pathway TrbL component